MTLQELRKLNGCTKQDALTCLGVSEDVYNCFEKNPGLIPKHLAVKMRKACGVSLDMITIDNTENLTS